MELNPRVTIRDRRDVVINKNGVLLWKDDPYRAAVLMGTSLELPSVKYTYYSGEEKFKEFVNILEELYKSDPEFLEALVPYLRLEHGRKLSPMVIIGFLLTKSNNYEHLPKYINSEIIDTPKRMAEVMAAYKLLSGSESFKTIPYKNLFKKVLESYDEYTLKKNRMRRRKIKLSDLIKVLKPRPKDEKMSQLYKAIIENDPRASLKHDDHITVVLSSKDLPAERKLKILETKIDKIPFNSLVKNLHIFIEAPVETKLKIRERFKSVLESLKNEDPSALRVIDPFMLYNIVFSEYWSEFGTIQDIVKELIDEYIKYWSKRLAFKNKRAGILLDISSVMDVYMRKAAEVVSVMMELYDVECIAYFDEHLYITSEDFKKYRGYDFKHRLRLRIVSPEKIFKKLKETKSPFLRAKRVAELFEYLPENSSYLISMYKEFIKKFPNLDRYIVISTEAPWSENDKNHKSWELEFLPNNQKQKTIIFNMDYMPRSGGVIMKSPLVLRITNLTQGTFRYLEIFDGDFSNVVKYVKEKYLK